MRIEHRSGETDDDHAAISRRRIRSHSGVCAGVSSRFCAPNRNAIAAKRSRRGAGGVTRRIHQMTGSAASAASSHGVVKLSALSSSIQAPSASG